MAWIITNSNGFTKLNNGTFENPCPGIGVVSGTFPNPVPDASTFYNLGITFGLDTVRKFSGAQSLTFKALDGSIEIPNSKVLFQLRSGIAMVKDKSYNLKAKVFIGPNYRMDTGFPLAFSIRQRGSGFVYDQPFTFSKSGTGGWVDLNFYFIAFESSSSLDFLFGIDNPTGTTHYAWTGVNTPLKTIDISIDDLTLDELTNTVLVPITLTETHTNVTSPGLSDGFIDVSVSGGVGPFTYLWSDGIIAEDRFPIPAGTYTLTVTDSVGQTKSITIIITQPTPPIVLSETHKNVTAFGLADGEIDITVNGGVWPFTYLWSDEITAEDRFPLSAGVYNLIVTDSVGQTAAISVTITQPGNLAATISKTDVTANALSDGTAAVNVLNGSGSYSFMWDDGPITQNRSNLPPGTYSVKVRDAINNQQIVLSVTITEPAPPPAPPRGKILRVPELNSLTFVCEEVIDSCTNPQTDMNTLLVNQKYERFKQTNYFQPVLKCDSLKVQFESDFVTHNLNLIDYCTGLLIKQFACIKIEQNIGISQDFNIFLKAGAVGGKTKVFFQSGSIPIPLAIGNPFTILNNADGFNGDYLIVDIISEFGTQYLVINKTYNILSVSSNATGRFISDAADYNVFEANLFFTGLPSGQYMFVLSGFSANQMNCFSEPINLQDEISDFGFNTFEVVYRNNDNGYGNITWTTGYIGKLRVPGYAMHKIYGGGERSTSKNSDYSITKINAKKTKVFELQILMVPPYMHFKLSTAFDCDYFEVNKVECQTVNSYDDPDYIDSFMLANSAIKVQQQNLFKRYNSTDLGNVQTGLITTEVGFIKR